MACEESCKSFGLANWTLAYSALHFFLIFHVNKSIHLLLNFYLNNIPEVESFDELSMTCAYSVSMT